MTCNDRMTGERAVRKPRREPGAPGERPAPGPTVGGMVIADADPGRIDRTSLIPFYHQLKSLVVEQIAREGLTPGDRLPSDHELCERYGVSRTVARQALGELEFEGVMAREKGRGTFVAQPKSAQGLVQSLAGLYDDVASHGMTLRSEVRRLETIPAKGRWQPTRGASGTPVLVLERLRFIADCRGCWSPPTCRPICPRSRSRRPGQRIALRDHGSARRPAGDRRRSVEARVANASLARDLGLPKGGAVLFLASVGLNAAGRPVEVFHAFHRGDRTRFEVALLRPADAGVVARLDRG